MATISDIAKLASVSPSTVSRVLNGSNDVSSETKARIIAVAQSMNYRPDTSARNLRRSKGRERALTHNIGFINFRPDRLAQVLFSFEATMAVEAAMRERGFGMRFVNASSSGGIPREVASHEVDGVIALGKSSDLGEISALVPTVSLDANNLFTNSSFSIVPDYRGGVYEATLRLFEAGHRRIKLLIDPPSSLEGLGYEEQVASGCIRAYQERGIPVPDDLYGGIVGVYQDGYEVGGVLFARREVWPDALIGSDGGMLGLYRAANQYGVRIPEDVSVIGIDGLSQDEYMSPPLTTIHVGIPEICRLASDTVIESVVKGSRRCGVEVTPVRLVERASVWKRVTRADFP